MPRIPTGRPRGRPHGTGSLGEEQVRCTVRLPRTLYAPLESFAEGRYYTGSIPPLSACVRELLDHALACPQRRQAEAQQREERQREVQAILARWERLKAQEHTAPARHTEQDHG